MGTQFETVFSPHSRDDLEYPIKDAEEPFFSEELSQDELLELLIDEECIRRAVYWLAVKLQQEIDEARSEGKPVIIGYLEKGALWFVEMLRAVAEELGLDLSNVEFHPLRVKTTNAYMQVGLDQKKEVDQDSLKWFDDEVELEDAKVIILDDLGDSGFTQHWVSERAKAKGAAEVVDMNLLEKELEGEKYSYPKYVGLKIPDVYVVGVGLDDGLDRFRKLMALYILRSSEKVVI